MAESEQFGDLSRQLVEFLHAIRIDELPAEVIEGAKLRLLDSLGCGLYGADTPWARSAARMVYEEQSQGRSTLLGYRKPVAPARAALVNGTAMHGMEIDDAVSAVHPGAAVVSSALAIAEHYGVSGARLILGTVAGYEATSRVSDAIGEIEWGFHKTGIAGVVGAAVACGVTLGMTTEQLLWAIGIACSSASGIRSFAQSNGGMIKRMHAGLAAGSGVTACLLARQGFTAPLAALDGRYGLIEVFGGEERHPGALVNGLGSNYAVNRVWTKIYPCCGALHTAVQGLYAIRNEHRFSHANVRKVRIGVNHRALLLHTEVAPRDTMSAQYSMPFSAALALTGDPMDPRGYADSALGDPTLLDLAQRVELYKSDEIDAVYPRQAAHVAVHLDNGNVWEKKLFDAHGTPADPCGEEEIKERFRYLVRPLMAEEYIAQMLSAVERIESLSNVEPLSRAMAATVVTNS